MDQLGKMMERQQERCLEDSECKDWSLPRIGEPPNCLDRVGAVSNLFPVAQDASDHRQPKTWLDCDLAYF